MNEDLMNAIEALAAIQKAAGEEYAFLNPKQEKVEEEEYRSAQPDEDDPDGGIPPERAREDRAKMLGVLRDYYRAHHGTRDGMDDFVTLVGVYCNDYIRWNLHQALPEDEDFGISELFDEITDSKLQKYLLLIQKGIFEGLGGSDAFDTASELYPYSLPFLYLFLECAVAYSGAQDTEDEKYFEAFMVNCLGSMNQCLQEYCLGTSPFLKPNEICDKNPLPYAMFIDEKEYHKARLAEKYYWNMKTLISLSKKMDTEHPKEDEFIDLVIARHSLQECQEGMELLEENDDDEGEDDEEDEEDDEGEEIPDRDNAILYRLRFLNIPCKIDWGKQETSAHIVINALAGRQRALREKEIAQKSKNKIVQKFTHTYKNLKATNLYHIATTLLARHGEEDQELGRTLLLEYSNKKSMTKDVYMMQLCYEHNTKRLRTSLQNSCIDSSKGRNTSKKAVKHVSDLVEQAVVTCLVNIFYDPTREDLSDAFYRPFSEQTLIDISDAFEQEVMQGKRNAIDLLRAHGMEISIDVAPEWDFLRFFSDEYAAIFLKDIFVELLVNVIKYGDLHQPVRFSLTANDEAFLLSVQNAVPVGRPPASGTQIGLSTMEDTLSVLWGDDILMPRQHQNVTKDTSHFRVQMEFPKAAFCKGSEG